MIEFIKENIFLFLSFLCLLLIVVLSLPVSYYIFKKDKVLGVVSLFVLSINAFLFLFGYVWGSYKLYIKPNLVKVFRLGYDSGLKKRNEVEKYE